ncbi:hypothetical protein GALL_433080 [mine drainage metagenome]|uniref:Uncharacterized protein n=1 Tax=mine drainage metagenome TaxID=410659 RepID=A0A1J5Q4X8_9ZZZZ
MGDDAEHVQQAAPAEDLHGAGRQALCNLFRALQLCVVAPGQQDAQAPRREAGSELLPMIEGPELFGFGRAVGEQHCGQRRRVWPIREMPVDGVVHRP